jgi:hypothetical protein
VKVYRVRADVNRFAGLLLTDERDAEVLELLDGQSAWDWWRSVPLEWDTFEDRPLPDFMTVDESPVLSARALEACADLFDDRVELLDIVIDGDRSSRLVNVTQISTALDKERAMRKYFCDGRVRSVYLYEFHSVMLEPETIFRLGYATGFDLYVTSSVVERVTEAGLTGFVFEEVWSDEPEAAQRREAERAAWRRAHGDDLGFDEDGIHVAHRIVPAVPSEHPGVETRDPRLVEVQARLTSLGIGPDDAPNGVYLTPLQHYSAHGEAYLTALHERLMDCGTQEELELELRDIGLDLSTDHFPTGDG